VVYEVYKNKALLGCEKFLKGEQVLVALSIAMKKYPYLRTTTKDAVG
jgi:hypothetical protein